MYRQTNLRGVERINQKPYLHICMTRGHRQQGGEGLGAGGPGGGEKWQEKRGVCITLNNEDFKKGGGRSGGERRKRRRRGGEGKGKGV